MSKHRAYLSVLIILMLLLSLIGGCSKSSGDDMKIDTTLTGESKHWNVIYKAKGEVLFYRENERLMSKSNGSYELVLDYKGAIDELDTMRTIKVEYPTGSEENSLSDAPSDLSFEYAGVIDGNTIQRISQGNQLEIKVSWDGKNGSTETIRVE